jgi:zinc protease
MAKLEAALDAEINIILKMGINKNDIARTINTLKADAIFARDSIGGGARVIGAALASGHTIADVEEWPKRISSVTKDQIDLAAKVILINKKSVTGLLLSEKNGS